MVEPPSDVANGPDTDGVDDDRRRLLAVGAGVVAFDGLPSRIASRRDESASGGRSPAGQTATDGESSDESPAVNHDWPAFGFDPGNTGHHFETTGPTGRPRSKWHFWEFTTGAAVADGTVYAAGAGEVGNLESRAIYAIDPETGERRWQAAFEDMWYLRPTVADGRVFVTGSENVLYALDADTGAESWRYALPGRALTAPTVADGTVYLSSRPGSLLALDADTGAESWRYSSDRRVYRPVSVGHGRVYTNHHYVGGFDPDPPILRALDAETGDVRWSYRYDADCEMAFTAATATDEYVYAAAGRNDFDDELGRVVALDPATGERDWSWEIDSPVYRSMAVAHDDLYVPANGALTALDRRTGDRRWSYDLPGTDEETIPNIHRFSPPAVADETIYVGGYDSALHALDRKTGEHRWRYAFGDQTRIEAQPVVLDGVVYAVAGDHLVAVTGTDSDSTAKPGSVSANYLFENGGAGAEYELVAGRPLVFSARVSTGPIVEYAWDFTGDGSVDETGPFASHVYETPGEKTATLRVTSDDGRTDTKNRTFEVKANE